MMEQDKFANDPWGTPVPYKEQDLLAQKIFGIKYFGWLSFWEQHHIVRKYLNDENLITK